MDTPEFEGDLNYCFDHIRSAFWQLNRLRSSGHNGPNPIQPNLIMDWCALSGNRLSRDEIEIVFAMDVAYITALSEENKKTQE